MKRFITVQLLFIIFASALSAQNVLWNLDKESNGIVFNEEYLNKAHADHIELSGEKISIVLRWGIDDNQSFYCERSLVFPLLRTIPNNTHASLMHRVGVDIPSLISVNGLSLKNETVEGIKIDGYLGVKSTFSVGRANVGLGFRGAGKPTVSLERSIFPSTKGQFMGEFYKITNISDNPIVVYIPEFNQNFKTLPEKGVTGSYIISTSLDNSGTYRLEPEQSLNFSAVVQAYREQEERVYPDIEKEFQSRLELVSQWDNSLILDTPDNIIDREFRFAKIRAAESIYNTKGGYLHGPGGESYYAAIWANDQAEYVNPFFPFLGYNIGNESALNSYNHFARFMNDKFEPIPSSIIAEGLDIWDGAGDRGDAAMIAHGASRYALARGSVQEAKQLWPLISWCLEYCDKKLNDKGVVASDTDELEGRFPAGDANLCTSTLYYDALLMSSQLAKELGLGMSISNSYKNKAKKLAASIEKFFGAEIGGYHTYKYYEGNTLLRSWICMPLIVGLTERTEGTIAALTSPKLMTEEGLLTEEGSVTFWDRSTLYSLRGIYAAGDTKTANSFMHHYSERRLLGTHVPYPVEAYPEGSQRHLSAESGLYCRAIIEGMFGLKPKGFKSFSLTPRMAEGWEDMSLKHVKAFDSDFDINVKRVSDKLNVYIYNHNTGKTDLYKIQDGATVTIKLQ